MNSMICWVRFNCLRAGRTSLCPVVHIVRIVGSNGCSGSHSNFVSFHFRICKKIRHASLCTDVRQRIRIYHDWLSKPFEIRQEATRPHNSRRLFKPSRVECRCRSLIYEMLARVRRRRCQVGRKVGGLGCSHFLKANHTTLCSKSSIPARSFLTCLV